MHRSILILAAAGTLAGQQFEVASLKPSGPNSVRGWLGGPGTTDPGQYSFGRATPLDLIFAAYGIEYSFQVEGKMPLDKPVLDFVAKLSAGTTREQFRVMMQNLLAERFHLKVHMETRQFPGYELTVAPTGLKLKTAEETPGTRPGLSARMSNAPGGEVMRIECRQEPMSVIARFIHLPDDPPVVDKTGLQGKYTFTLEYANEMSTQRVTTPSVAPDLFRALRDRLGLQLVPRKLPFEVVVVDSIDKAPTAN